MTDMPLLRNTSFNVLLTYIVSYVTCPLHYRTNDEVMFMTPSACVQSTHGRLHDTVPALYRTVAPSRTALNSSYQTEPVRSHEIGQMAVVLTYHRARRHD